MCSPDLDGLKKTLILSAATYTSPAAIPIVPTVMFKRTSQVAVLVALIWIQRTLDVAVRTVPPLAHALRAIVARERIHVVMIARPCVAKQLAGTVAKKAFDVPLLAAAQMKLVIQKVCVAIRVTANAAVFASSGVAVVVIVDGPG